MKKVSIVLCIIGFAFVLSMVGCGDNTMSPEDVAKKHVTEKFMGTNCDLEDLDYSIIEEEDDAVQVRVKGKIRYDDVFYMVKQQGKWVPGTKVVKIVELKTGKDTAAAKKDDAHHAVPETTHH